jgi:AcrR family transcriptional regulator
MSKPVKRTYDSPLRREQAARTRARIVEEAATLFEAQGFGRTTIRQIADAAGVAPDTVYATFGTKARVLTALIDARLAPDGETNVTETAGARAVQDAPDQRSLLHRFAEDMATISTRTRGVFEILRTASAVDPDMAAVHAEMEGHRAANMARIVDWLEALGPLRVDHDEAVATVWALAGPDVARLLCDVRGWSREEHAAWLDDTLCRALLPDERHAGRRAGRG